jgi:endo-1,4-beta-mannosidase
MDYSQIKGFNYQPSYGRNGLELWRNFDAEVIRQELGRGKAYFPGMNAIRLWLSWDAFIYADRAGRGQFCANLERALAIAADLDLKVMPVLFNRWHNEHLDYGGIYIDHFVPGAWGGAWAGRSFLKRCHSYVDAVVRPHCSDERILAWDLCNEPFSYGDLRHEHVQSLLESEYAWLKAQYDHCRALDVSAPVTIGAHWSTPIDMLEPISDLLSIHPYWSYGADRTEYERHLDADVGFARKVGKPLLSTETCWGHLDDQKRVEIVRYTLGEHAKRGIGWLAYLLHHSLIADAHRPEFGPVGDPMNLAFIEADGSLRPGHQVFNEF